MGLQGGQESWEHGGQGWEKWYQDHPIQVELNSGHPVQPTTAQLGTAQTPVVDGSGLNRQNRPECRPNLGLGATHPARPMSDLASTFTQQTCRPP